MTPFADALLSALRPPPTVPIDEWSEANIVIPRSSPFPGRLRLDNSPWIRQPLLDFADPSVSEIDCMTAAQSSKTTFEILCLAWAIANDPSGCLFVMPSIDEAKKLAAEKLMPVLEESPAVAALLPAGRTKKMALTIYFQTMPLWIVGGAGATGQMGQLASKSVRRLFLDEVGLYRSGAAQKAEQRVSRYWNSKVVAVSCPSREHDEIHERFLAGSQHRWFVPCPVCGKAEPLVWTGKTAKRDSFGMVWDSNEWTRPEQWNFDRVAATVRYRFSCGHEVRDDHAVRKHILRAGRWVQTNKHAPASRRSYHWSQLIVENVKWSRLVEQFIRATSAARNGFHEPLRMFVCESLGEPWVEGQESERFELSTHTDYDPKEKWKKEHTRFLTVDVHAGDLLWCICRAWSTDGESRLVKAFRCVGFEELEEHRKRLGVTAKRTMLDAGYAPSRVYAAAIRYGWSACLADSKDFYVVTGLDGKNTRQIFRETRIQALAGLRSEQRDQLAKMGISPAATVKVWQWAKPAAAEILSNLMAGEGAKWSLPDKVSDDYTEHMGNMRRVSRKDAAGIERQEFVFKKPDHLCSCELQQILCAALTPKIALAKMLPETKEDAATSREGAGR